MMASLKVQEHIMYTITIDVNRDELYDTNQTNVANLLDRLVGADEWVRELFEDIFAKTVNQPAKG